MHIKQHKRFGGICICSVIMSAHGKLKFLLASSFPSSLPPGLLILSPIKELLEQTGLVAWGWRKQRERKIREGDEKKRQPSEASPRSLVRQRALTKPGKAILIKMSGSRKKRVQMNFLTLCFYHYSSHIAVWLSVY